MVTMNARSTSGRRGRVGPEHRGAITASVARRAKPQGKPNPCDACAADAFLQWHDSQLPPAFNAEITFQAPAGKRLVIEFVTATIEVPAGESARLRMFTGFSSGQAGNLDLTVVPQGIVNGRSIYVATHSLRTYADGFLAFNVNRDNAFTPGYALICVSGYLV
jgi:hypothetical protein